MSSKYYKLCCDFCGWNKVITASDADGLIEFKRSKIQVSLPKWDEKAKKMIAGEFKEQGKMYRCQKCSRPVQPRKITDPQGEMNQKARDDQMKELLERERKIHEEINKSARSQTSPPRPEIPGQPSSGTA